MHRVKNDLRYGITPAWAGKRWIPKRKYIDKGDHPRVGGEKLFDLTAKVTDKGSPPRGRGKAKSNRLDRL